MQRNLISDFANEHTRDNNSVKGRAYQAVNNALNGVAGKVNTAHGFAGAFKAQAVTGNRVQRHLPAPVGDGTLADDPAINAFATKGLDGKTAGLAYA